MMHPLFRPLLATVSVATGVAWFGDHCAQQSELWFYALVLCIQSACFVNSVYHNRRVQTACHEAFAFVTAYGNLTSTCPSTRALSFGTACVMLGTRLYVGRCIFVWWSSRETRCITLDLGVCATLAANLYRSADICSAKTCLGIMVVVRQCL